MTEIVTQIFTRDEIDRLLRTAYRAKYNIKEDVSVFVTWRLKDIGRSESVLVVDGVRVSQELER